MNLSEPISHIMTESVITIDVKASLHKAEAIFRKKKIRHLPVLSGENLVGIVSLTDLQRLSFVNSYGEYEEDVDSAMLNMLRLSQVMVSHPVSIQVSQTIREAAELLSQREFHALPVLDGQKLVGIVTTTDLIRYMLSDN